MTQILAVVITVVALVACLILGALLPNDETED